MDLFDDWEPEARPAKARRVRKGEARVEPFRSEPYLPELARDLPAGLRMGTSSWSFPGWRGLVWLNDHSESDLSRHGLRAYSSHPLLRSVSLARSFYRPLSAGAYAAYAVQLPADFRCVGTAPSLVCDAVARGGAGSREGGGSMATKPRRWNGGWTTMSR